MRRPRVLILGLDGVGPELVEQLGAEGLLPNLSGLRGRGAYGPLASTVPPTTLPAWTSFMTGASPSEHGVPDFTVRQGYRVRFVSASLRALPTIFEHLEAQGLTAGAAWFPATYPPERLRGYQISGWDSPVTSKGNHSFVFPPDLHEDLERSFGDEHLLFDAIDEFSGDEGWYERAASALVRSVRRRARVARWLLEHRPVDVAAFYFGETDTVAHHFWAFHDPRSPRRPPRFGPGLALALRQVYRAVDHAVGELVDAAGSDASVVVLSDHGSGGASHIGVHLNRMLERAGLLRFSRRRAPLLALGPGPLRGRVPALVPQGLRRTAFRLAGGLVPTIVESDLRFGGIDWSRTRAFSEELTYAPSIWLNQRGREPRGIVSERERDKVIAAIESAALALRTPEGHPLVRRVIRRDELHRGPLAHLFPDVSLRLHRPDGYTPACLPSRGRSGEVVVKIPPDQLLGRKGRSLPGCHTDDGVLFVVGAAVAPGELEGARLEQVAPAIAALAGVPSAPWFSAPLHRDLPLPEPPRSEEWSHSAAPAASPYSVDDERVLADRLRRLGYLE